MYRYSRKSLGRLGECHPLLQTLMNKAIKHFDISIIQGYRDEETQNDYFERGLSKVKYPNSKHNHTPSLAVDFCVWHKNSGLSWNRTDMLYVCGFIEGLATQMGIKVRTGARWNKAFPSENGFADIGHIELIL